MYLNPIITQIYIYHWYSHQSAGAHPWSQVADKTGHRYPRVSSECPGARRTLQEVSGPPWTCAVWVPRGVQAGARVSAASVYAAHYACAAAAAAWSEHPGLEQHEHWWECCDVCCQPGGWSVCCCLHVCLSDLCRFFRGWWDIGMCLSVLHCYFCWSCVSVFALIVVMTLFFLCFCFLVSLGLVMSHFLYLFAVGSVSMHLSLCLFSTLHLSVCTGGV